MQNIKVISVGSKNRVGLLVETNIPFDWVERRTRLRRTERLFPLLSFQPADL